MQLTRMAWRNIWRNKRRSWVTIAAMALGLWVMIGYAGLVRGYLLQMERQILDVEVGDVQVHAPGYRDDPSLYRRVEDAGAMATALRERGFRASPRLLGAGLAAAADNSSGAQLIGVDVARDAEVSAVHAAVEKGRWLVSTRPSTPWQHHGRSIGSRERAHGTKRGPSCPAAPVFQFATAQDCVAHKRSSATARRPPRWRRNSSHCICYRRRRSRASSWSSPA